MNAAFPEDGRPIAAVVRGGIPETIELSNIPYQSLNEFYDYPDDDDDQLSFVLGVEHTSNAVSKNLIPSHRDMSLVSCNDCASIIIGYPVNQQCLPVRLHNLLSDAQASCMWLPHGRAFMITDMAQFVSNIIPQLFVNNTTNQYSTFLDSMEGYGFQQAVSYLGLPAFYHKRFLRFRWWLVVTMEPRREITQPIRLLDDPRSLAQGFFHLEPRCEEDSSPMRILLTTPRSPAQAQYVFECLPLLPSLQYDMYLSYSAVVNRHFSGDLAEDHHHNLFRQRGAAAAAALHYIMMAL